MKNLLILKQKKDILLLQTVAYAGEGRKIGKGRQNFEKIWRGSDFVTGSERFKAIAKQGQFLEKWRRIFISMINRVDGNNYYVYTSQKKIDIPDTGEKFNLDYKNNESSPETKDKKEISDQEKQQQAKRSGVMLELSSRGRDAGSDRQRQPQTEEAQSESKSGRVPLFETIQTYVTAVIAAVREFFYNIWHDQSQEGDSQDVQLLEDIPQEPMESIDVSDEMSRLDEEEECRDSEIQEFLRIGDMDQVMNLLTDNGKRTIARNSTLLTSYDKNGKVVEPSASDMERVLHGNRNTWEL